MAGYKPKVISLTKRPEQTLGFYLRVEQGEEGHLIRSLETGGPAQLAGMKDGDRIIRVNGTFTDSLSHSVVVDLVRNSGVTVTFHTLDEASYKQAKAQGINLSSPQTMPVTNGVSNGVNKHTPKPKLCYLVKSSSGFGFSLRSVKSEPGLFMTEVIPGGVAERAGVKTNDRLFEVNGESVEDWTHDRAVNKLKEMDGSLMFLLADEETDKYYQGKRMKIDATLATTKFLPHQPRIIKMAKGSNGYGFLLKEESKQTGHFIRDIDRGSPSERAGLKDMDRLVAVDGQEVNSSTHEEVVDKIKKSGNDCCLLVVDKETAQMYEKGRASPMLFWEEMKEGNSPPSYTEAVKLPAPVHHSSPLVEREEELKPKLCRMEKTSAGYGFHLNGIQGKFGQHVKVREGGAADRAGLKNDDVVVEVNGRNVEQSSHEEVVEIIRDTGNSLELLVAEKSVYEKLKAKGVTITRLLLGETSYIQVHSADIPDSTKEEEEEEEEARPETPTEPQKERTLSVTSSASQASLDERL